MKIGIDIDDTITNSSDVFVNYAKKYNNEKGILFDINLNTLDMQKSFGWEKENQVEFLWKYLNQILENASVKPNSVEVINKLKDNGNKIYFITSRSENEIEGNMYELTKKWLDNNNYKYDLLIIESKNKLDDCIKYGINIFIDDNYLNCKLIKEKLNIPVLLFSTRYNADIHDNTLIRVEDWLEIYDYINKEVINDGK